eukprot:TRINITY_DN9587_c0_g1_i2.p1 TRINITY_DN9587_c0_g1~~TRINITY_DN9587_c0_g1_i2.p1  ORF type:complete len:150 (+),score=19.89 TRINITY_DN9587_c0_g1_i2:3-452(+)
MTYRSASVTIQLFSQRDTMRELFQDETVPLQSLLRSTELENTTSSAKFSKALRSLLNIARTACKRSAQTELPEPKDQSELLLPIPPDLTDLNLLREAVPSNADPDINFTCVLCGKTFTRLEGFKTHIGLHRQLQPLVCSHWVCHNVKLA